MGCVTLPGSQSCQQNGGVCHEMGLENHFVIEGTIVFLRSMRRWHVALYSSLAEVVHTCIECVYCNTMRQQEWKTRWPSYLPPTAQQSLIWRRQSEAKQYRITCTYVVRGKPCWVCLSFAFYGKTREQSWNTAGIAIIIILTLLPWCYPIDHTIHNYGLS